MKTHVERTREEIRRWQVFGDAQRTVDHALDLARMLDAVLGAVRDNTESACYCDFDADGACTLRCEHCELSGRICAITGSELAPT